MQLRWQYLKNAIANLGRGSAASVTALLLPPILVRHMSPAGYAIWVLVLQAAGYASYLNFGLQTAVGRYVAYSNETGELEQRDSIFSTAFMGLCAAAFLSLLALGIVIFCAPWIFPGVPSGLVAEMRWTLLIVGLAAALDLPASAWSGVFIGLERYEVPAIAVGSARIISAIGLVAAALAGKSLIVMGAIVASSNIGAYAAQFLALRQIAPTLRFRKSMVRRSTARELWGYCLGLTVMSFATLLVSGVDLVLVGRFEFKAVTPYSVSASMVAFISGGLYAVINVIMPHAAALHARKQATGIGRMVVVATRISTLLLVLTGLPILIWAGPILRYWIGQNYVATGVPVLTTLIVANIIRLVGVPYSILLIATGQQNYIKISPLAEGLSNFIASVILGILFGAIGVAIGTLIGSVVSIASHLWYSMPRTRKLIRFSNQEFIVQGVLMPLLWTIPIVLTAIGVVLQIPTPPILQFLAVGTSCVGGALLLLRDRRTILIQEEEAAPSISIDATVGS